jgi:hypothetical protein
VNFIKPFDFFNNIKEGLRPIGVFSDSSIVVNWMIGSSIIVNWMARRSRMRNMMLIPILDIWNTNLGYKEHDAHTNLG